MVLSQEKEAVVSGMEQRLTAHGGPFAFEQVAGGVKRFKSGPHELNDLYRRAAQLGPKRLLLYENRLYTYSDIFGQALKLAAALRAKGLGKQRVALCLHNKASWIIWFVAVTSAGLSCVLVPDDVTREERRHLLRMTGVHWIVSDTASDKEYENLIDLPRAEGDNEIELLDPDTEALIVFSSGSTADPKAIVHSHRSLLTGHRNMMFAGMLSYKMDSIPSGAALKPSGPSVLLVAPLHYIAGYSAFLFSLATGGFIAVCENNQCAEMAAHLIETEVLTSVAGAGTDFLRRLIRQPAAATRLISLRQLQLHGAGLQSNLVAEINRILPNIRLMTGYGLSETAGSVAAAPVACIGHLQGMCGRIVPTVDVRIVDREGGILTSGASGDIEIRGDMLMTRYLLPIHQKNAFTSDGWFKTGDVGYIEEGAWLYVTGRRMAESDEFDVFALENALREHHLVDDVVIILPRAVFIQLAVGRVWHQAELVEVAARFLPAPLDWHPMRSFPRTASGKVDRAKLQEYVCD